ncbi:MAG: F0F1 ATP synthase subunit B [Acidocella sp. 20-57-95]|nr:MAG: F0F1 ATP synthase subunit B [Acidocella sp. 20-57-95]OYV60568.1 MAG: F0F1 ATP synthase subunit B [Acidocella sp. 21-58-7]HQT64382.1 F0F1 ATP synthase subunit B [Acidocella sp.]HQU04552.1 F0F1 ATP synthase subunit B [Acidocella sp.]
MEYQAINASPWEHGSFWVAVAIVIFVVLFAKKIIGPVIAMLDARTASVQSALDEAAKLKAEAQAMLADAQARQAQAIEDAKQIIAHAEAEAARTRQAMAADAKAMTKRRERLALDRIAAAEKAALEEVRAVAIDVATAASSQLLRSGFAADGNAAMIDQAISGVPAALRQSV